MQEFLELADSAPEDILSIPMVPIRDVVVFPHSKTAFVIGRAASVLALEEALTGDRLIFLAAQHDATIEDPKPEHIYPFGTIAFITNSLKKPDERNGRFDIWRPTALLSTTARSHAVC